MKRNLLNSIVVTGFMAAGKSTIAAELAAILEWPMLDLDQIIVDDQKAEISEIINSRGEPAFRAIETEALSGVLAKSSPGVVALGGGAWTVEANRRLIRDFQAISVWIDTPFDVCWSRITETAGVRPLARDIDGTRKLFDSRRDLYALADIRQPASKHETPTAVARAIISKLTDNPEQLDRTE